MPTNDHAWELVLQELQNLREGQDELRKDFIDFRLSVAGEASFRRGRNSVYASLWALVVSLAINLAAEFYKLHR